MLSFRVYKSQFEGEDFINLCPSAVGPTYREAVLALQKERQSFVLQKPLHVAYVYDDIECPCVVEIKECIIY